MGRTLKLLVVAGAVAAGSLAAAGPATAITNCSSYFDANFVRASCSSSAGALSRVRAVAYCRSPSGQWVSYGNWVYVNQTSSAFCGTTGYAYDKAYHLGS